MPVFNIVDHRNGPHKSEKVLAIIEDSWHDYVSEDRDIAISKGITMEDKVDYIGIRSTSVQDVIQWVNQEYPQNSITLFLYDVDDGQNYTDYQTIIFTNDQRYKLVK